MNETIRDLNLSEEKINEIMEKTQMNREDLLGSEDFHLEITKGDMAKWIYDEDSSVLLDLLIKGETVDNILENLLVFNIESNGESLVLFLYE